MMPALDKGKVYDPPAEGAIDCNLLPAIGDFDMGDSEGLALKSRKVQDEFSIDARMSTGAGAFGAFDLEISYDASVLEVLGVVTGKDMANATFSKNYESTPGKIWLNASLSPNSAQKKGDLDLFTINFKATNGGSNCSTISDTTLSGIVKKAVAVDSTTGLGTITPRNIVAGAGTLTIGGPLLCHKYAACSNNTCSCKAGYTGNGTTSCKDIDECSTGAANCTNSQKCMNTVGGYVCTAKGP